MSTSALQLQRTASMLRDWRTALALAWRAEPTMGHRSPASAAQQPAVTELALLGRASCSIAAPLPGQRASSSSFAANSPSALLRPAPPAPRRKCSCMSHGHVRHRSLTLPRPICGRSSPAEKIKCVGRQTANVKHSGYSCFVEQHGSLNSALLGVSPAAGVPTFGSVASVSQIRM